MTWLSRLLPQDRSFTTNRKHRDRLAQRRRRMSALEPLEDRIVLSNVTVTQDAGDVVHITGDTHNDTIAITINPNQTISVVGSAGTQVNNHPVGFSYTSPFAALGLTVDLYGNTSVKDNVTLTGQGQTVASQLKSITVTQHQTAWLTIDVDGVRTAAGPGSFSLYDGTSTVAGGQLNATISNSQFSSLTVYQTGCCPAIVDLENDNVAGAVSVTEGVANGDQILIDQDPASFSNFGSTYLEQYVGPTMGGCNGDNDLIAVDDANIRDLTIYQNGPGHDQHIVVGLNSEVEVASNSFGVYAEQTGDGHNDLIEIVSITSSGRPSNNLRLPVDSIETHQGNGNQDTTIVDSSFVWGDIITTQGNGAQDVIQITGDTAGWTLVSGPKILDLFGDLLALQGNGANDVITLDCGAIEIPGIGNSFNNAYLLQGNAGNVTPACTPNLGDTINVNCTTITSDLVIIQGFVGETDEAGVAAVAAAAATASVSYNNGDNGNNVVNIATTMAVTVGDETLVLELGKNNGNNLITMGGASGGPDSGSVDFETGFLDVYVGYAGGSLVSVSNTLVDYGAYFFDFNINGEPDNGDTLEIDNFSSLTVTSSF